MTGGEPRAGRREGVGLAVLALPAFVIALDFSVLNLAVPVISRELMPTATQLLWIVDIYGFILAGFLVTMGTLVGGARVQVFWWGAVFLLAVPVMAVLLAAAPVLLPEYRNAAAGRPDFLS